ncbi:bifunctional UDP-N-acetylglucosamine diphosphorylase/glucosamine-1-phosphate N-acetyltransferase GlmU [uncultured Desulfovibrio sp.]|uniref:bifunctional UDP-N-acetylglucosamine diphosphorylase/glucosamine-1-phosphate N-acetyltransferase GlmU n=1 Tax=uncultured Desulfovibrio sp. TaxID=167968 RepID=UPI00260CAC9D|nr:bifunctional UDP-N-acetylglucosamine diphosphorylase/glucosamine-1-phosphate N-acetyltransferase GlmU [uncultured Desulfovibrio sp.]
MNMTAVILAAGKGTRMHSDKPKVLQTVLGEPMLRYVREALRPVFGDRVLVVVGHRADMIESAFAGERFVRQTEQLGTGHALMQALPELRASDCQMALIVNGDTPLLRAETVAHFMKEAEGADLAFATISLDEPGAYGRVVRDDEGHVSAIVEARDYDMARYGAPTGEVNAGMYAVRLSLAETLLPRLSNANRSGEYYITDLVGLAVAEGRDVRGVQCGCDESLMGVNSPRELAQAEECLRASVVDGLLDKGVLLHAPALVRVSPLATVEAGAELFGPCEILGASHVERGARIESCCVLRDSHVCAGAEIRSFSHLEQAQVGQGALVGPYARLRPGAVLERESHVGNFVELKKARLGIGSKANHLTYLGDADIGSGVNIGAGTITCNYDGRNKHRTVIGDRAFIGSNTALVAPVTLGEDALVGAGSVITHEVPAGQLAVARGRQKNLPRRK